MAHLPGDYRLWNWRDYRRVRQGHGFLAESQPGEAVEFSAASHIRPMSIPSHIFWRGLAGGMKD